MLHMPVLTKTCMSFQAVDELNGTGEAYLVKCLYAHSTCVSPVANTTLRVHTFRYLLENIELLPVHFQEKKKL